MTEKKKAGLAGCLVCTGCGKCVGERNGMHVLGGDVFHFPVNVQAQEGYIVAVDIGTTTIAMALRRISDGMVEDVYTAMNPQRSYGLDVMSRIQAASDSEQAKGMQRQVRAVLAEGLTRFEVTLKKKYPKETPPVTVAIAANTSMVYLLMGLDTEELGKAPFEASYLAEMKCEIEGYPGIVLPGISAFIGADIMAGMYVLQMCQQEEIILLADLGTNGELVLGNKEGLIATATAAGPAFEGSGINGFAADKAALIAYLKKEGIVDESGLLSDPYFDSGITMEGILISQQDIRQFQMAKGAICAGIHILMETKNMDMQTINKVYLAGGFGCFLSPQAAEEIGLLPKGLAHKTIAVGNTALEGAYHYVRDQLLGKDRKWEKTIPVRCINLAMHENFNEVFMQCLSLSIDGI